MSELVGQLKQLSTITKALVYTCCMVGTWAPKVASVLPASWQTKAFVAVSICAACEASNPKKECSFVPVSTHHKSVTTTNIMYASIL